MFSILALNAAALIWTLLPTTIILMLFYTILQIYLKSAQSIKRLEGTKTIFSGNVGLAISQTLILTGMLQFGVRQTAEVISQMTSVERILQYTHIEREPKWEKGG
ncbi:ABC transporter family C protein ABCC2 [Operophtera brumata]|uniref:ABC transporter family C protein ABCC2 n=1 Tax=Operophtera brumata TaxID=104452 RepID=A0A0L7KW54_OPEBR|nr:ABC transporter family C protein ABCC2 [Operophtera brumata]